MKILSYVDGGDVVIPYTCMGYHALLLRILFIWVGIVLCVLGRRVFFANFS